MKLSRVAFPLMFNEVETQTEQPLGAIVVVKFSASTKHHIQWKNAERVERNILADIFAASLVNAIEAKLKGKLHFQIYGSPANDSRVNAHIRRLMSGEEKITETSALFALTALAELSNKVETSEIEWNDHAIATTGGVTANGEIIHVNPHPLKAKLAIIARMPDIQGVCLHEKNHLQALPILLGVELLKSIKTKNTDTFLASLGYQPPQPVQPAVVHDLVPLPKSQVDRSFRKLLESALAANDDSDSRPSSRAIKLLDEEWLKEPAFTEIMGRSVADFPLQAQLLEGEVSLWGAAEDRQNTLISGDTGTGKTAVAELLILRTIIVERRMAFYLAPTRALAGEFHRRFLERYGEWIARALSIGNHKPEPKEKIVLSTGDPDESLHDNSIRAGAVWLACIVFEKASSLMAHMNIPELSQGDMIGVYVIDELHMIADRQRGGVVDMLLAKTAALGGTFEVQSASRVQRIVALTTESAHGKDISRKMGMVHVNSGKRRKESDVYITMGRPQGQKLFIANARDFFANRRTFLERLTDAALRDALFLNAPGGQRAEPSSHHFIELLNHILLSHGPNLVLIFVPSQDEIYDLAARAKNRRLFSVSAETKQAYVDCLKRTDLRAELIDQLAGFAGAGVFVHCAELPSAVKEFVERKFSQTLLPGESALVLTTETLSYGVNLCADVVVLMSVIFPRSLESSPGVLRLALEPNAFSNMIGRVGRPGLSKSSVVYVSLGDSTKKKQERSFTYFKHVMTYYFDNALRLRSSLFRPSLHSPGFVSDNGRELSDFEVSVSGKDRFRVGDEYSYSAFRAICDGLRFIRQWGDPRYHSTSSDLVGFLREFSFFGRSDDVDPADMKTVVDNLIRSHSDGSGEVLFSGSDRAWAPTVKALALIDNGVHPSAVQSLKAALEEIRNYTEWSPSVSLYCLVAGFVCSPEFWNLAAVDLVQEADVSQTHLVGTACRPYLNFAKRALHRRISTCDVSVVDAMWDAIFTASVLGANARLYINSSFFEGRQRIIFYKLMDIVLGWLDGEGEKQLLEIYYARTPDMRRPPAISSKAPRAFPAKIAEKLAWLATATCSYFEEDVGLLPNRLRFFVSSVSARLSYGLPASLIPFRGFGKAAKNRSDLIAASKTNQLSEAWAVANALEFYKRRVREMILVPFIRDLRQIHFADSVFGPAGELDAGKYHEYLKEAVCQDETFHIYLRSSCLKIRNGAFVVYIAFGCEAQEDDDIEESVLLTCSDNLMAPGGRVDVAVGICACGLLLRGFVTPETLKRLSLSNSLTLESLLDNASDQLKEVPFLVRGLVQYPILSN